MVFGGVDIGASATKAALMDDEGNLLGWGLLRSGVDFGGSAAKGLRIALAEAGLDQKDLKRIFACGYGRGNADFADETRTEIACHAAGAYHYFREALTIVDIGCQDNKIIKLNAAGARRSFKMNRKCAAGTGAFLEEMALRLDLPLESFDQLAAEASEEAILGAYCTVFTATEVLAKIREGASVDSLVKGLFRSVVKRVLEMDTFEGLVVLTGGVAAHNPFLARMLAQEMDRQVKVPPHPQLAGAIGAALLAMKSHNKQQNN
jgi:(R)-2-hydroxyacyl-CoA dehydratese activating ATPase